MQNTNTYLELLHERGKRGLPLERVYRQLFNVNLYLTAYGKIYRNKGALTKGVTAETVDGMSLAKIETIIQATRQERYQWKPARRIYIPKKNGKNRPLGMPVWSDKVLAEVIRMILQAYYEPQFSDHSHGFRPGRGCHTALREIYHNWHGTVWFIEGDISRCFEALDHDLLLTTLSEHIHDGRFLHLLRKLLDAGYLENWTFQRTLSGVPQGSIVSPILANILLDKLDKFVETVLIPTYTRGVKKKRHRGYKRLMDKAQDLRRQGRKKMAQALRKQAQHLPSGDPKDSTYRRLKYCRYADDFLLGFVGPRAEAEAIKQQLETFLRDELHLELSQSKTLITHARSQAARFLGYEITTLQQDSKHCLGKDGKERRSINGTIGLRIPREVVQDKCHRYLKNGKAIHRAELRNESDYSIVAAYQATFRGIANYYRLAYNLHSLNRLKWVMEQSLTKTLAGKHHLTVPKVYQRYAATAEMNGTTCKTLQAVVLREKKKPLIATWGGVSLKWDIQADLEDGNPHPTWIGRSELEKRLVAQVCELCGASRQTDPIEVHHIRALKDLTRYTGRERPLWVKTMASRRRKTLVLCRTCHQDIQHGRPMRRQNLKHMNASPVPTG